MKLTKIKFSRAYLNSAVLIILLSIVVTLGPIGVGNKREGNQNQSLIELNTKRVSVRRPHTEIKNDEGQSNSSFLQTKSKRKPNRNEIEITPQPAIQNETGPAFIQLNKSNMKKLWDTYDEVPVVDIDQDDNCSEDDSDDSGEYDDS